MRLDVRFAGVALGWNKEYAESYASKLREMGFSIRVVEGESFLIAYSHKSFSTHEMQERLDAIAKIEG